MPAVKTRYGCPKQVVERRLLPKTAIENALRTAAMRGMTLRSFRDSTRK